jgi:hypothetical protein
LTAERRQVELKQLWVCIFNIKTAADRLQNRTEPLQEWADKDAVVMFFHQECFHNRCIKGDISFFKTDGYFLPPDSV